MTEPKTISELISLSKKEFKTGNFSYAIVYLHKAIAINPNDDVFYLLMRLVMVVGEMLMMMMVMRRMMLKLRMMSHFFSKCDRSTLCIITRNLIEVTIDLNKIVWKAHTFFKKEKKKF